MQTTTARWLSVALLPLLAACADQTTPAATETDRAWCESLRPLLPSRSHSDTVQTQDEIGVLYDFYEGACLDAL